jgi:purine-nucleoside phosphorylase
MTSKDSRHDDLLYTDPLAAATEAAREIANRTGVASHDVALVMGSGWVTAVDALGTPAYECDAHEITGFAAPAVEGHSGKVRSY